MAESGATNKRHASTVANSQEPDNGEDERQAEDRDEDELHVEEDENAEDQPDMDDDEGEDHQPEDRPAGTGKGTGVRNKNSRKERDKPNFQLPEEISKLFKCGTAWELLLEAVEDIDPQEVDIKIDQMKAVGAMLKHIRGAYRLISRTEDPEESQVSDLEADIKRKIDRMKTIFEKTGPTGEKKDRPLIKDICRYAIPKLVLTLRAMVMYRYVYLNETLDMDALEESVDLITFIRSVCAKAIRWQPRPEGLERGIMKHIRFTIPKELNNLRKAYKAAVLALKKKAADTREEMDWEEIKQGKLEKRRKLEEWIEATEARERERRERLHRSRTHFNSTAEKQCQPDVLDIDDLDINFDLNLEAGIGRITSPSGTGVRASRTRQTSNVPRLSRERTEDIPPNTTDREWTESEDAVLLHGLEKYRDADRYLKIADRYGAPGAPLSQRDVDELMRRALFYKQSMMTHIEEEIKAMDNRDDWDYILSIDG